MAKAIAYVFGDTLICDNAETAKLVTFSDAVFTRSVTLDGDVYDPSGTLSGGSAPNSTRILIQVQELLEIENKLRDAQARLNTLEKEEEKSRTIRNSWKNLVRELEIKEHELKLLEEQVEGSNAALVSLTNTTLHSSSLLLSKELIRVLFLWVRMQMKLRKPKKRSRIYVWPFKLPKRSRKMLRMTVRS